jgi:uncharacterized membrane protein YphA (DoxX/SURF4 family)
MMHYVSDMETVLWILQSLLAGVFLAAGLMKLTQPLPALAEKGMGFVEDLGEQQVRGIGVLEVAAAIGLVVPAALDLLPVLTAAAACGVVALMAGAAATHVRRREAHMVPVNLVLAAMALFVAIERLGPHSL